MAQVRLPLLFSMQYEVLFSRLTTKHVLNLRKNRGALELRVRRGLNVWFQTGQPLAARVHVSSLLNLLRSKLCVGHLRLLFRVCDAGLQPASVGS